MKGRKRVRQKDSFVAVSAEGNRQRLTVWVDVLDAGDSGDPSDGMPSIQTTDGLRVNVLEKGRYQIVQTGEVLTSDAPNAL